MDSEFDSILHSIYARASFLPDEARGHLVSALAELAKLIGVDDKAHSITEDLARIDKYLGRFKSSSYGRSTGSSIKALSDFARSSSQGKWKYSKEELRRLQPPFWKALESNAEIWHPKELSNLLSYSLRRSIRIEFDPDLTSRTVARLYHEYFRSLNHWERDALFEELLQRALSEPEFRHSLVAKERHE